MAKSLLLILFTGFSFLLNAQLLPGFKSSGQYNEQQLVIEDSLSGIVQVYGTANKIEKNLRENY